MEFKEAVRTVLTERYADFNGRARRSELWWFVLFSLLVSIAIGMLGVVSDTLAGILNFVVGLALLIPSLSVGVRRLHDTDRTGWWILVWLIPLIGWIILIVFYVQPGTPGENRFGPDPKREGARRFT